MEKMEAVKAMNQALEVMRKKYIYKENVKLPLYKYMELGKSIYKLAFVAVNEEEFKDFIYEGDSELVAKKRALIVHEFMLIHEKYHGWKWLRISTGNEYDNLKTGDFPFTQKRLSTTFYNDFETLVEFLTELVATSKFENTNLKKWLEY